MSNLNRRTKKLRRAFYISIAVGVMAFFMSEGPSAQAAQEAGAPGKETKADRAQKLKEFIEIVNSAVDAVERIAAMDEIAEMGAKAKDAVPALLAALADEDPAVRCSAARALGMIGAEAADALPELKALTAADDEAAEVSQAAQKAIKQIEPLFTNDAVVLGMLIMILALIFQTQRMKAFKEFYKYVPALLLCYFIPSILNSAGVVSGGQSNLYFVVTRYLLPTSLVLLTLSIDLKKIMQLGPKAIIMFLTGTVGVVLGGPFAVLLISLISPDVIGVDGPEAVWRALTTVAGSWIGGGANQTAMKEIFQVSDDAFSAVVAVDILVASVWMGILLYGAGISEQVDRWFKADSSSIEALKVKVETFQKKVARIPDLTDLMLITAFGFGVTAISHVIADFTAPYIQEHYPYLEQLSLTSKFFWLIVCATTFGLLLSFTKARNFEGAGASKIGTVFIYILVATIGMEMDVMAVFRTPGVFVVGFVWIGFHAVLLIAVGKLIRAPFFFLAVGSQANIGGAASAPVVASAFHPALAPVGVLLAVLGYALGTYCAWFCGLLMQLATPAAPLVGG